jgi:hypothetical protein
MQSIRSADDSCRCRVSLVRTAMTEGESSLPSSISAYTGFGRFKREPPSQNLRKKQGFSNKSFSVSLVFFLLSGAQSQTDQEARNPTS